MDRYYKNPYLEQESSLVESKFSESLEYHSSRLLNTLISKLQADRNSRRRTDTSVYTGSAGISLLYWNLSKFNEQGGDYLKKAYETLEPEFKYIKGSHASFLAGAGGPLALGCVLAHQLDKSDQHSKLLKRLLDLGNMVCDISIPLQADEILYGRAGYLYSLLFVNWATGQPIIEDSFIQKVVNVLIDVGKRDGYDRLFYAWHDKFYLGAAHGITGILYILLKAEKYLSSDRKSYIQKTLDWILGLRFPGGNLPSSYPPKDDRLIHFCHGAPGAIYTYLEAHTVFGDSKYLEAGIRFGEEIWKRGILRKGYSLCHGVAGNSYALRALYHHTQDDIWLRRSKYFAKWCFDYGQYAEHPPDRPLSLFEGLAGVVYLLTDFAWNPHPKFPAYQF